MSHTDITLSGPIVLAAPAGPPVSARARGARLGSSEIEIQLTLAPGDWPRVVEDPLFGAHPSVMPTDGGRLDPGLPVIVILSLHPRLSRELLAAAEPGRGLVEGLADPGSRLCQTEHWRLLAALQPAALPGHLDDGSTTLESGFATVWEREHRAGFAPLPLRVAVKAALREHDLEPVPFSDSAVRALVEDEVGTWTLVVMMDPGAGVCTVYSAFPRCMAAALRPYAADTLCRINAQLAIGALELDEGDGQLRVRTGVDLGGPAPGVRVVERTIGHNLALMREAWPTFEALAPG